MVRLQRIWVKQGQYGGLVLNQSFSAKSKVLSHRYVSKLGMLSGELHFPREHSMVDEHREEGIRVKDGQVVELDKCFWNPMTEL